MQEGIMSNEMAIDFEKMDGLVAGIVQDAGTGQVLMLGFLNPTSYAKTLETGYVTFWSRTRQKLWMKGESSGNRAARRLRLNRLRQRHAAVSRGSGRRRPGLP